LWEATCLCRAGFSNWQSAVWPTGGFLSKKINNSNISFLDIKYGKNTRKSAPSDFNLGNVFPSIPTHYIKICDRIEIIIIDWIYTAFFYQLRYSSALHSKGETQLIHHQCVAPTWVMHGDHFCARTLTTHQLSGGEVRSDICQLGRKGMIRWQGWNVARL
jgi:hypothetical protein